jgi:hypothetical protein
MSRAEGSSGGELEQEMLNYATINTNWPALSEWLWNCSKIFPKRFLSSTGHADLDSEVDARFQTISSKIPTERLVVCVGTRPLLTEQGVWLVRLLWSASRGQ